MEKKKGQRTSRELSVAMATFTGAGEFTGVELVDHKVETNQSNQSNLSSQCLQVNLHIACGSQR